MGAWLSAEVGVIVDASKVGGNVGLSLGAMLGEPEDGSSVG